MRPSLLLLVALYGCDAADPKLEEETAGVDSEESGGDSDSGNGGETGGETGDSEDSGEETGDTGSASASLSDLAWELDDDVGSVVFVSWTQSAAAEIHIEYRFDDEDWQAGPTRSYEAGANRMIVVGIPFGTDAEWRVVQGDGEAESGPTITTEGLDRDFPLGEVTVSEPAQWLPEGAYMLTSINEETGGWTGGTYWTYFMDRKGRVVWAHKAPDSNWTLFAQTAVSGDHFLWDEATYWSQWDDGATSKIHRWYLDGELEVHDAPGLHHAWIQHQDGTLAWGSQYHGEGGRESPEVLVEWTPGDEDVVQVWDTNSWPNSGRNPESNGMFYNEKTRQYIYSYYTNNSIVAIDRDSGETMWWAGDVEGGYAFNPRDYQYSWQHGISYTREGYLLVSSEPPRASETHDTWLLEYTVDDANGELDYVWGCGGDAYASTNGDAWQLPNGNYLHTMGAAGVIRETTPDCVDVWRIDYRGTNLLGRGELVSSLYDYVSPEFK